ncbi:MULTISPECIES: hypothetical protein [unclassified Leptolyngbya]|uniref:hypothetical protein n=1 Tax=unclassified Leptolyngbya TaxID=2650499 RepID=UPI001688C045|nr:MULTISPECIES: hypothetical protein [unclassified Leptolyngbya]MBD1910478.1 hypothetical protein [Leptolyngbya sp. FACHB-8]MBD2153645.1 hypothetical protein [Leptolyngbya sp. FACHB-16]
MSVLLSCVLLVATILMFRLLVVWPATFLSWLHIPLWLTLGIVGGILAWCIADD